MKSKIQINNRRPEPGRADAILKATALLYLEEALNGENYEDAPDLIRQAYNYGAKREEVRDVIGRFIRKRRTLDGNIFPAGDSKRRF